MSLTHYAADYGISSNSEFCWTRAFQSPRGFVASSGLQLPSSPRPSMVDEFSTPKVRSEEHKQMSALSAAAIHAIVPRRLTPRPRFDDAHDNVATDCNFHDIHARRRVLAEGPFRRTKKASALSAAAKPREEFDCHEVAYTPAIHAHRRHQCERRYTSSLPSHLVLVLNLRTAVTSSSPPHTSSSFRRQTSMPFPACRSRLLSNLQ